MDVLERFKRLTASNEEEDAKLKAYCQELEKYILEIEANCKKAKCYVNLILKSLEDEGEVEDSYTEAELELPVEDYKLIREKFGEDAANKMYYDVKFGRVPLRFVQRYLTKIAN